MTRQNDTLFYDRLLPGVGRLNRRYGTVSEDVKAGFRAAISELLHDGHLEAIRTIKRERTPVVVVYDLWKRRRLDLIGDVDLEKYVQPWERWARQHANARTVEGYAAHVRALLPEGKPFARSDFTRQRLQDAANALGCSGPTVRRYLTSWSTFANFLIERGVIGTNPLYSMTWPRENKPRDLWLPLDDVKRLIEAQPEPYRALAALREGTGAEISAALKVKRSDVDETRHTVRLRGTKNTWRDRFAFVDEWAMDYLARYIKAGAFAPEALLFAGVSGRTALKVHKRALKALGLPIEYTMHDARHSYAVRKMKAGAEPQLVASNMGHHDGALVLERYGRYRPAIVDIQRLRIVA